MGRRHRIALEAALALDIGVLIISMNRAKSTPRADGGALARGWLSFFLRGVAETAEQATDTAERIFELRE
jgi:hypothetical protein